MSKIMTILCEDGSLKPGTKSFKVARKLVSNKIDRLEPDKALAQVEKEKAHYLDQMRILCNWHKFTGGKYPIEF